MATKKSFEEKQLENILEEIKGYDNEQLGKMFRRAYVEMFFNFEEFGKVKNLVSNMAYAMFEYAKNVSSEMEKANED